MPFGLTNAPATFQRLMECVLAGLTFEQCLIYIYIDDIIVFSATFPKHLERLRTVFEHLARAGLKLKPKKCHFARSEIRYLGHIVSRDGVKADPEMLHAITSYPTPRDVKELRQFLGLTNCYRLLKDILSSLNLFINSLGRQQLETSGQVSVEEPLKCYSSGWYPLLC